jgi:Glyoxalase-like domain
MGVPARLTAIVIDALDAQAQARFRAQALQWQLAEPSLPAAQVAVRPADPDGIGLLFISSARPKTAKNRLHLELAGGHGKERLVHSLLGLGAVRVDIGQGDVPWEVLADPEGSEFCVLPEAGTGDRLAAICLDAADPADQRPVLGGRDRLADRGPGRVGRPVRARVHQPDAQHRAGAQQPRVDES